MGVGSPPRYIRGCLGGRQAPPVSLDLIGPRCGKPGTSLELIGPCKTPLDLVVESQYLRVPAVCVYLSTWSVKPVKPVKPVKVVQSVGFLNIWVHHFFRLAFDYAPSNPSNPPNPSNPSRSSKVLGFCTFHERQKPIDVTRQTRQTRQTRHFAKALGFCSFHDPKSRST